MKKTIINVDFPGFANALGVTTGYIGKLHYVKKTNKDFFAKIQQTEFIVYRVREEDRGPWYGIYFPTVEDVNFFKLAFGADKLHQTYIVNPNNKPSGTFRTMTSTTWPNIKSRD